MKKTILFVTLTSLCLFAANVCHAQPGTSEEQVKALAQQFNEADVFYNVDSEPGSKALAFNDSDVEGAVKCWRWYYRPTVYYYTWRPAYYRPYYCYYRYYCPVYYTYFSWSTVTIYKGGESYGAVLDSEPTRNSPLAAKGLRKGDIVTAIDGKPLQSLNDMKSVTANSNLTVFKGNNVKFAGNLVKNADEQYRKSFDGLQEAEAGTLLTKAEILTGDFDMHKLYDKNSAPVFGVKAAENNGNGVKVNEVVADMPGQKAGFEVGDVILEINGQAITSEQSYSDAIDCSGSVARMKVLCGKTGQIVTTDVVLNK